MSYVKNAFDFDVTFRNVGEILENMLRNTMNLSNNIKYELSIIFLSVSWKFLHSWILNFFLISGFWRSTELRSITTTNGCKSVQTIRWQSIPNLWAQKLRKSVTSRFQAVIGTRCSARWPLRIRFSEYRILKRTLAIIICFVTLIRVSTLNFFFVSSSMLPIRWRYFQQCVRGA